MVDEYTLAINIVKSRIAELEDECTALEEELREGEQLLQAEYASLDKLKELQENEK